MQGSIRIVDKHGVIMSVINIDGISKSYGDVAAVSELSLTVESGEVYGLLGPNGAGKTTTIEVLTGQTTPDTGSVSVLGVDPVSDPVGVRERIGIQPERESPPSFMTPREYFRLIGEIRGISREEIDARVGVWADKLAFAEQLDSLHSSLSQGQKQKVMLTQAFIHDPAVVVIDEPLVNLDPGMQERVKTVLGEMAGEDRTVVLSTHDIGVAAEVCSRVGIVAGGSVAADVPVPDGETEASLLETFSDVTGMRIHESAGSEGV